MPTRSSRTSASWCKAMAEGYRIPGDYAIDALTLEAERRRKQKGIAKYGYSQLMADTTPAQREAIIEEYRQKLIAAHKAGKHRVKSGIMLRPETSAREVEDAVCQKLEGSREAE